MARLFTTGFELREKTLEGGTSPEVKGTVTVETTTVHKIGGAGGGCSMKMNSASAAALHYPGMFLTGAKERWTYYRHYLYVDKAPGGAREIIRYSGPESAVICSFQLNAAGDLILLNGAGASTKTMSAAIGFAAWQRVELAIWTHASEAAKCKVKVRVNGTVLYESEAFTGKAIIPEGSRFGWIEPAEASASIYFDDIAVNDSTGATQTEWPGEGLVAHLLPASDKARTGFVAGGAPTTEKLFEALGSAPPLGVAQASSTHGSQIKDNTNNATDNYETNLQTYEAAGISGTVDLVQGVYMGGYSSTTSQTLAASIVSNPTIAEVTLASGTTAAATHPTGWKLLRSALVEAPSVTLGTAPVLRFRKGTATTNYSMYEYGALQVEWTPSTSKTVAVGQASETDTAQALTHPKRKAVGQSSEADLAQALTHRKTRAVGQPSEADLAQAMARSKVKAVGQVVETDLAQPVTRVKAKAVGQPSETDTAQAITHRRGVNVGQPTEADTAQAIASHTKAKAVGLVTEADLAQPAARRKTHEVGQASEVDLAQGLTRVKLGAVGQPAETDSAQALAHTRARAVGQPAEVDVAQAVAGRRTAIGQAQESDQAHTVVYGRTHTVGAASEVDEAQALSHGATTPVGQASEGDFAAPTAHAKRYTVAQALESDAGLPLVARHTRAVAQANEVDSAQPVLYLRRYTVGEAEEHSAAGAISALKQLGLGMAMELDQALPAFPHRMTEYPVAQAFEGNFALAVRLRTVVAGTAIAVVEGLGSAAAVAGIGAGAVALVGDAGTAQAREQDQGAATVSVVDQGGARAT